MSLEAPRTPSAENSARKELAELLRQKQELEMILGSNRIAVVKNPSVAGHEQVQAAAATERLSQDSIRAGLAGEQVDTAQIAAAQERQATADEWRVMADEGREQFQGVNLNDESDPLAQKLRSLGVSAPSGFDSPEGHVATMVLSRLHELEGEIHRIKLEIPGGKEELTIDALRATQLTSGYHLDEVADSLRYIVGPENMRMSVAEIVVSAARSSLNRYPLEVQKSALAQVFTLAAERVGNSRAAAIQKELPSFLEQVNRYLEEKSARRAEAV